MTQKTDLAEGQRTKLQKVTPEGYERYFQKNGSEVSGGEDRPREKERRVVVFPRPSHHSASRMKRKKSAYAISVHKQTKRHIAR